MLYWYYCILGLCFCCSQAQTQTIAYLQEPDSLLQELPSYQAMQEELHQYHHQLEQRAIAKQAECKQHYQEIIDDLGRICATPKYEMEIMDSINGLQADLEAYMSALDSAYEQKVLFLKCFVQDEMDCAIAQLVQLKGYDWIVKRSNLPYGGIDATPALRRLLQLPEQKE